MKHAAAAVLAVDKPQGMTSHDVIQKLKKKFKFKKIGYAGTLDPLATGVLAVCTGAYTRLIQYLNKNKKYRAEILLGLETDSYDITGKVVAESPIVPDNSFIRTYLQEFVGTIVQKPPVYSAVHYQGKRLYEYARAGTIVLDIPERQVTVYGLDIVSMDLVKKSIIIDINCSEGTYIRSIAHDLGQKLGCGACLSSLRRTVSSGIPLEKCYELTFLLDQAVETVLNDCCTDPVHLLDLEVVTLDPDKQNKIGHGIPVTIEQEIDGPVALLSQGQVLIGIGVCHGHTLKPKDNFLV